MCEKCKVLVTAVSKYGTELQYEYHILSSWYVTFLVMPVKGRKEISIVL